MIRNLSEIDECWNKKWGSGRPHARIEPHVD
jgi:hypothetical protein